MKLLSTVWVRLALFTVALLVAFGAAYAVGSRSGEQADAGSGAGHGGHVGSAGHDTTTTIDESLPHTHDTAPRPAATSVHGYELRLDGAGPDAHTLTYRIVGPDGNTVTSFADNHGAMLHAVLIRPDLSGFQHVHPEIAADGTWSVTVPEGQWHLVFDLWPAGASSNVVLSTNADDEVPVPPVPLPAPDDAAEVDGLVVSRDGLTFTATTPDGAAATGLEPFLGSPAHLILIRSGDLAYNHLHPAATGANTFTVDATLPSGTYRAFLQFGYDGAVVTVPYTVVLP